MRDAAQCPEIGKIQVQNISESNKQFIKILYNGLMNLPVFYHSPRIFICKKDQSHGIPISWVWIVHQLFSKSLHFVKALKTQISLIWPWNMWSFVVVVMVVVVAAAAALDFHAELYSLPFLFWDNVLPSH